MDTNLQAAHSLFMPYSGPAVDSGRPSRQASEGGRTSCVPAVDPRPLSIREDVDGLAELHRRVTEESQENHGMKPGTVAKKLSNEERKTGYKALKKILVESIQTGCCCSNLTRPTQVAEMNLLIYCLV